MNQKRTTAYFPSNEKITLCLNRLGFVALKRTSRNTTVGISTSGTVPDTYLASNLPAGEELSHSLQPVTRSIEQASRSNRSRIGRLKSSNKNIRRFRQASTSNRSDNLSTHIERIRTASLVQSINPRPISRPQQTRETKTKFVYRIWQE